MKKFLFASISICLAAAITSAPLTALAAEEKATPEYPEILGSGTLEFSTLVDFAVADDTHKAFVGITPDIESKNPYIILLNGEVKTEIEVGNNVSAIDYADGNFYYTLSGSDAVHMLTESGEKLTGESPAHDFGAPYQFLDTRIDGYLYYQNDETGYLTSLNTTTDESHTFTGVTTAKRYGGTIYGILDNELYKISGTKTDKDNLIYSDYDKLKDISVGDMPEKLKKYSTYGENTKLVIINSGALLTEFDLDLLAPHDANGNSLPTPTYFPVGDNPRESTYDDISGYALLLAEDGNVCIIAKGDKCYVTDTASAPSPVTISRLALDEGTTATVNAPDTAYSLPYMSVATSTFKVRAGEVVTVLYSITKDVNTPLAHDFYLIETADGERGYMSAEYLEIDYPTFDEGSTSTLPDPAPKDDDYVKTVVLVLVVILLVLIAAAYLTWLGTTGKFKKSAQKGDDSDVEVDEKPDKEQDDKQ